MMVLLIIAVIIILVYIVFKQYKKNKELKEELKKHNGFKISLKSSFWEKIFQPIFDLYEKYNFILYFITSIIFYVLASQNFGDLPLFGKYEIEAHSISNIFTSIGTVILSSGVFSSITKSNHFLSIFSNEIKKIVYTEKFLSKQKDIDQIWNVVTKSICKENFHKISDKLFEKIKSNYLPINHNFYYEDFNLELLIKLDDNNPELVTIEEITKVDLICENTDEIDYSFSSNIAYDQKTKDSTSFQLVDFKVNNVDEMKKVEACKPEYDDKTKILKTQIKCKLDGSIKYTIYRKEIKKYSLKLNPNRVHSALKIYNNFEIMIHYPQKMDIRFSKLGIDNIWEEVEVKEIGQDTRYLKTKHEGIFFQNQGYMLNFFVD